MPGFVPPIDASSAGDDGGGLSGLSGIFSTIGNSITQVYTAVNPPKPVQPLPGSVIYNPQSGQYQPVTSMGSLTSGNTGTLLVFIGIGLGLILLLKR